MSFFVAASSGAMEVFALGWLVVLMATAEGRPERAPLYLGVLGVARVIPAILLSPIVGVTIDRADRRLLLIVGQCASAVPLLLLGAAVLSGTAGFWMVLVATATLAVATVVSIPTRLAVLPRLVGERDVASATGLDSMAHNVASLVGPLVGGVLIAPFGVGGVLVASGLGQLLAMVALTLLPPYPVHPDGPRTGVARSLVDGLRYVRGHVVLSWLLVAYGAGLFLVDAPLALLPALARDVLQIGPVQLSWLLAAGSAGALLAGLLVASLRGLERFPIVVIGALALAGLTVGLFVRQREIAPLLLGMAGVGFASKFAATSVTVFVQTTTPDHLRGRVNSLFNLVIEIALTTGTLLVGALATAIGVDHALTLAGLALAVVCVGVASRPAVRRPRTAPTPAEAHDGALVTEA